LLRCFGHADNPPFPEISLLYPDRMLFKRLGPVNT
jgi:hypothetical protein